MTSPLSRVPEAILTLFLSLATLASGEAQPRQVYPLDSGWRTTLAAPGEIFSSSYLDPAFSDQDWEEIRVPHNWESYQGFRQLKHGNLHGTAWYRKQLAAPALLPDQRAFLFFEGVGSYATVWLNGEQVGYHAGGLTTFTLDVTDQLLPGQDNLLVVRSEHPAGIRDLPWVCGGCELAMGFSEGTQPFGIFRPVQLVVTSSIRIAPFGVHVWNGQDIRAESARLNIAVEMRNHGKQPRNITLRTSLREQCGDTVFETEIPVQVAVRESRRLVQESQPVQHPRLWSPGDPYLYNVVTELVENGEVIDSVTTPYGIRWLEWPDPDGPPGQPLLLNGQPVFINGVADYEHQLGCSHAFTDEQVEARVRQIQAAGFNAFRDAHHPHNLRFNEYWDRDGMLWWTQFGAHIWFESEDFQANYKSLLRDWIRERRNSPSLFLYGLQNESKLPTDFARECVEIIREMDPTASTQRLITTCNGGTGTDWDVPQNWSGTYGGNLFAYDEELRDQKMVGEYGAWRSLEFHSEGGFIEDGPLSEDRMAALMETKVRLGEKARAESIGHFAWPFTTHQNPGRNFGSAGQQVRDGIRHWDRIGPANNKGLFTIWGEPLDVFYMYRSNYADPVLEPMVYIVSHSWPDRWTEPGLKDGIIVYSNADEVELFNGYRGRSLGIRQRQGIGTHFRWDGVGIRNNVLYAEARVDGETVATDLVALHHLPADPGLDSFDPSSTEIVSPKSGYTYLYRVNCGGESHTDGAGNTWMADRYFRKGDSWGSVSWASQYKNLHPFFGSKREISDPVIGTAEDPLFQSFRYGREQLRYRFAVPDGDYRVELYLIEPWYGTGGGIDCTGWRMFDIAINGQTAVRDFDPWAEAGRAGAIRLELEASARDGWLEISFPRVAAGQAVLSAIAVASEATLPQPSQPEPLAELLPGTEGARLLQFLDTGARLHSDGTATISFLSWELREADWIQTGSPAHATGLTGGLRLRLNADAEVFVVHDPDNRDTPDWLQDWDRTGYRFVTTASAPESAEVYARSFAAGETVSFGKNERPGIRTVIIKERFPPAPAQAVHELKVFGSAEPSGWQALGNFKTGQRLHEDSPATLTRFSSRLSDCDWLQTPEADAQSPDLSVSFSCPDHVEVYVALDPRVSKLPAWLDDWLQTDWYLSTDPEGENRWLFLKKRFRPGERIELGPNGTNPGGASPGMYSVVVRTVRADVIHPAAEAIQRGPEQLDWVISVGVGDRYGLNFQYRNSSGEAVRGELLIVAERDGMVVCEDAVEFLPTGQAESWTRIRTCDDINAGTYFIRLKAPQLARLEFELLQVE